MGSKVTGRVAIYARFSTDKQSDSSVEDQVYRAREWLRTRGADPDGALVLSDRAVSGASLDRPGMRALLSAIRAGRVDTVVTESIDRISRDMHDALGFRKEISYHGVTLECLDGTRVGADSDKGGFMLYGMRSMMGEQYIIDLADKTRRGLEGKARAGKATGALPYGYRNVKAADESASIQIDADRASVIRRIFRSYEMGKSFAAIADALNRDGIEPPRPNSRRAAQGWMHSAVREMLLNERYRGIWSYGEREWRKVPGTNRRLSRPRLGGPLVTMEIPELAIIDADLWLSVQQRFARHAKHAPKARRRYMLSGLARCGLCSGVLQVHGGSASHRYYACANARKRGHSVCSNRSNVLSSALEREFIAATIDILTRKAAHVREVIEEEIREWMKARPEQKSSAAARLLEIEKKLRNLVDALAATGSSAIASKVGELERQRDAARSDLANAERAAPKVFSAARVAMHVQSLATLTELDPDQARETIRAMLDGESIRVTPTGTSMAMQWGLLPARLFLNDQTPPPDCSEDGVSIQMVAGARYPRWRNFVLPVHATVQVAGRRQLSAS